MKYPFQIGGFHNTNPVVDWYNTHAADDKYAHTAFQCVETDTFKIDMIELGEPFASYTFFGKTSMVEHYLFQDPGYLALLQWSPGEQEVTIKVAADNKVNAVEVLEKIVQCFPTKAATKDEDIKVNFWSYNPSNGSGNYTSRAIAAPQWNEIQRNYSAPAATAFEQLFATTGDDLGDGGKIMLLHGPAGSGKTTAIRALAQAWKPWCDINFIVDADSMFNSSKYLMNVLLTEATQYYEPPLWEISENDIDGPKKLEKWRLLIIEDAEEYIVPQAKNNVGAAVSRLLNISDGFIGQGLKLLILLTTNAPVHTLHPAIVRPGRCMLNLEVPKLTATEAAEWSSGAVRKESTLAELFEATNQAQIGTGIKSPSTGTYL